MQDPCQLKFLPICHLDLTHAQHHHVQLGDYFAHDLRRLATTSQEHDNGSESVGDEETTGRKFETRFSKRKVRLTIKQ